MMIFVLLSVLFLTSLFLTVSFSLVPQNAATQVDVMLDPVNNMKVFFFQSFALNWVLLVVSPLFAKLMKYIYPRCFEYT